jgi:DivIVA domain-containing protein
MPVTPTDVRNVTFNKPPLGRPGYHEEEVDDFLDLVEAELARLIQHNTELHTQVAQWDQQLCAMPDTTADPCPVPIEARGIAGCTTADFRAPSSLNAELPILRTW